MDNKIDNWVIIKGLSFNRTILNIKKRANYKYALFLITIEN